MEQIKEMLKNRSVEEIQEKLRNIILIDSESKPTKEDIKKLSKYTDLQVSTQSTSDWYCLVRKCQGDLYKVLESGYILAESDTPGEEYTYVLNLDSLKLDWYIENEKQNSYSFDNLPNW